MTWVNPEKIPSIRWLFRCSGNRISISNLEKTCQKTFWLPACFSTLLALGLLSSWTRKYFSQGINFWLPQCFFWRIWMNQLSPSSLSYAALLCFFWSQEGTPYIVDKLCVICWGNLTKKWIVRLRVESFLKSSKRVFVSYLGMRVSSRCGFLVTRIILFVS